MESVDVVVVGAGAAGLMAARELSKAGKKILILEARDRIGGRIYPLDPQAFGYEAEGGGEFVHGDAPITTMLVAEAGLHFEPASERAWWNVTDGPPEQMEWKSTAFEGQFVEALQSLTEDTTVRTLLDARFSGEKYAPLRDMILRRLEGYDAADASRASAFMLRDEMLAMNASRQRDLNFKEGYGALVRFLADECRKHGARILLQKEVVALDVGNDGLSVTCKGGERYAALQVILTVPPPIIKTIFYKPPIPEKIRAAELIGYGGVIKVLLRFKNKWWAAKEEKFDVPFFMLSREAIPTWWTQYPAPYLTLTGWVAGPSAERLAHHTEAELIAIALQSLSNIFEISLDELKQELIASRAVNWIADPYARGAYSYETPETDAAREELLKPVGEKLFFAGEALGKTEIGGTVEAAFASGLATAKKILQ